MNCILLLLLFCCCGNHNNGCVCGDNSCDNSCDNFCERPHVCEDNCRPCGGVGGGNAGGCDWNDDCSCDRPPLRPEPRMPRQNYPNVSRQETCGCEES